ncbi:MAG: hypothetical protein KR126chlam5_00199 [Candidatus Anoxychlamydiales bacterium]|nr:hypothetical protein [Candidatus Anoxychlamydiales bacterium]
MMRNDDIKNLLKHEEDRLINIKNVYDLSLKDKTIPTTLRIDIKNAMENLRSALDYMAQDINKALIIPNHKKNNRPFKNKNYFPYGEDKQSFEKSIKNNLPDLKIVHPDIYSLIEDLQPHACGDKWLQNFCQILNDNKHNFLSEQTRTEQKTYKAGLTGKNPVISAPAGSITAAPGDISIDNIPITFDSDWIPQQTAELEVTITTWVSFVFQDTNVEVYPLLMKAFYKIKKLSETLYEKI